MKLSYIAGFVHQCALDANANFSLDGEKIGPKDLADEHALLPLVVAAANTLVRAGLPLGLRQRRSGCSI